MADAVANWVMADSTYAKAVLFVLKIELAEDKLYKVYE